MNTNNTTIDSLIADLIKDLEDNKAEILNERYPEDRVTEIADGWVPVYYRDLAACLMDDVSLAELDDEGLAEGVTDVFKRIQIAIYERLSSAAFEWLYEAQESQDIEAEAE
jgi:hypothetical protein